MSVAEANRRSIQGVRAPWDVGLKNRVAKAALRIGSQVPALPGWAAICGGGVETCLRESASRFTRLRSQLHHAWAARLAGIVRNARRREGSALHHDYDSGLSGKTDRVVASLLLQSRLAGERGLGLPGSHSLSVGNGAETWIENNPGDESGWKRSLWSEAGK